MNTKVCTKCKEEKPLDRFHIRNGVRGTTYKNPCKDCTVATSKEWIARNPDYKKQWLEKNPDKRYNYDHTPSVTASRKKYQKSPEGKAKRYAAKKARYHTPENSMKHNARAAIKRAVKKGILPSVSTLICSNCNQSQAGHYHHYLGYEKENRLNVMPVCQPCHLVLG